jgi:hypothetical protein
MDAPCSSGRQKGNKERVGGSERTLHNEKFHNLYISANIIGLIKLIRNKLAGRVA